MNIIIVDKIEVFGDFLQIYTWTVFIRKCVRVSIMYYTVFNIISVKYLISVLVSTIFVFCVTFPKHKNVTQFSRNTDALGSFKFSCR